MNSSRSSVLAKNIVLLAVLMVAAVGWAQKKTSSAPSHASAPASHASAPASHSSAPSHSSTQSSHPTSGTHAGSTGGSHAAGTTHAGGSSGTHAGSTGGTHTTAGTSHAGSTGGTHASTTSGTHAGATGGTHAGGSTGGAHTTAGTSHAGSTGGAHTAAGTSHAGSTGGAHTAAGTSHAGTTGGAHATAGASHAGSTGGAHAPTATHSAAKNFKAPAGASKSPGKNGGSTYTAKNGAKFGTDKSGHLSSYSHGDTHATFRSDGHVGSIHAHGMDINRGAHGGRTVETHLRGGGRVVGYGRGRGFVERPFNRGGREFSRRSYWGPHGGYARVYGRYGWGGGFYGYYVPGFYYAPAFYGWGWHPWGAPVVWGLGFWGWGGAPWYGYYGAYFAPWPAYPSPAWWLTDWFLSAELQNAYQAHADAVAAADAEVADDNPPPPAPAEGQPVGLSPEVKQAIADEVARQLKDQQAAAATPQAASAAPTGAPGALNPTQRVFVVSADLSEPTANGDECALTPGDIITRLTDTPDTNQNVNVSVLTAKQGDCGSGAQVTVAVADLQDMYNHFQEQLGDGMGDLKKNQGMHGMPSAPGANVAPTTVADGQAQPDADAQSQLQQQQQQADQTEQQVTQEATSGGGGQ